MGGKENESLCLAATTILVKKKAAGFFGNGEKIEKKKH